MPIFEQFTQPSAPSNENEPKSPENRAELDAQIESETALLQRSMEEFNELSASSNGAEAPEATEDRWEAIRDTYESARTKINVAFGALFAGTALSAMSVAFLEQHPQLVDTALGTSGSLSWAATATFVLGHAINMAVREIREKDRIAEINIKNYDAR